MAQARFVSNVPQLIRRIDRQIMQNHKAVGIAVQRQIKRNIRPGGIAGFKKTHGGSGLLGSIGYLVYRRDTETTTRVGSGVKNRAVPYAAIHETGGWIYAKSGGALAIPIHKDAKKAKSPLAFGADLTYIERGGKPPLLIRLVSGGRKRARSDIMYVLQQSVFLPRRSYLRPALAQQFREIKKLLARGPRSMRQAVVA